MLLPFIQLSILHCNGTVLVGCCTDALLSLWNGDILAV